MWHRGTSREGRGRKVRQTTSRAAVARVAATFVPALLQREGERGHQRRAREAARRVGQARGEARRRGRRDTRAKEGAKRGGARRQQDRGGHQRAGDSGSQTKTASDQGQGASEPCGEESRGGQAELRGGREGARSPCQRDQVHRRGDGQAREGEQRVREVDRDRIAQPGHKS